MPSHVTIRTVMQTVDSQQLIKVFNQWCTEQFGLQVGETVALDGKALGSTVTAATSSEQDFVSMVSAFVHQRQQVVGVTTFHNGKSGEGEAVRTLLKQLKVEMVHITLDALHGQKKTLAQITEAKQEYTVQLKGNCSRLWTQAQQIVQEQAPYSSDQQNERQKGRQEQRTVHCFEWSKPLSGGWQPAQIATLIVVDRHVHRDGELHQKRHYYLSNAAQQPASFFAEVIRGHWLVENGLHWPKDVIQKEDEATISQPDAAETLSIFKSIAINLFRHNGFTSIKEGIISLANKPKKLWAILQG